MTIQILIVIILTFVIYVVGTLAYSVRVVAIKTGRIAVAFSIFNIFALLSRSANIFQAPLLAKTIEKGINLGNEGNMIYIFRWVLLSATLATIFGAILMPTFIKIFSRTVESFSIYRSIPKLIIHGFSKTGIEQFKNCIAVPKKENISQLKTFKKMPKKVILLSVITSSISTVGVLSALYAGSIIPELRSTCNMLSPVINGIATILMFLFVDPFISMLTDDVLRGKCSELYFYRCVIFIIGGLFLGTILAQLLLIPASYIIITIAKIL